jgi:phage terminase large subunit-like protein
VTKAGPKQAVDASPLPFRTTATGARRFARFCQRFVTVPEGEGALGRLRLRQWQVELVASVLDATPRPRLAAWMLPRGSGKSSLAGALALYDLLLGEVGARVVVVATDERQAGIVFAAAARMVELHPELARRVQVYADRLQVPGRGASLRTLPAVAKRLEGLNPSLAIVDEFGYVDEAVWEVVAHANIKRRGGLLVGIGTPPPDAEASVLWTVREHGLQHPEDASFVWREHSAAGFEHHPVDCRHCWTLANKALGDFAFEDGLVALLPPKTREASFRRAHLCQFVTEVDEPWLPAELWDACADPRPIPDGAEVVLGFDGSWSGDTTALVACTIGARPHLGLLALWEAPEGARDWRVDILAVEATIQAACQRFRVREVACDPYRWSRSLQVLRDAGLPMVEYPQSPERMTPAVTSFYEAVVNKTLTHSGDGRLARHVGNAVVREDARGIRITKPDKHSRRRIDAAVAAVMALDRAAYHARDHGPQIWIFSDAA